MAWIDATSAITLHSSCLELLRRIDPALTPATEDAIRSMFLSYFERGTDWLLIFDNADYLDGDTDESIGARDLLESYLPKSAGHILITTRCNRDFANANRVPINVFTPELAIEFLAKRTGQKPDKDAELLAERLGYLPLALEYAGSYIKQHTTYSGYLKIWQEHGMELFDQENAGYAEQTVRKAFRISLDKLRSKYSGSKLKDLLDFLVLCAVIDLDRLPIDALAKIMAEEWKETIAYFNNLPNSPGGKIAYWSFTENGERISHWTDGEITVDVVPHGRANSLLNNLIRRNELIRMGTEYSLVGWDSHEVSMHPLLRAVIREEFWLDHDRNWAYQFAYDTAIHRRIYEFDGNTKLAGVYEYKEMRRELNGFISNLGVPVGHNNPRNTDSWLMMVDSDLLRFEQLLFGIAKCVATDLFDEALIWLYRYLELLHKEPVTVSAEEGAHKKEEELFKTIADLLGRNIIFKSFNSPETYQQTGKRYNLRYVNWNGFSEEGPVIIKGNDILIYFDDIDEAKMKIPSLLADGDADWRIIVLPDGMEYEM